MVNPRQCLRVSAWHLAEETATFYKSVIIGTMIDKKLLRRITANGDLWRQAYHSRISVEMILSLLAFSSFED
jgi:hypothetical protein